MVDNPFLKNTNNIADNQNHAKKDVANPFITEKEKSNSKKEKNTRKSILFYQEDYNKIVALSKTKGETIVGLLNILVEEKINSLSPTDVERYQNFLK